MHAAVVSAFDAPPRYQSFSSPVAVGPDQMLVDVLAAGLHPRVRSQADGSHYTSAGALPCVPGIDGVGRGTDGLIRYFVLPDTSMGSMAEQTIIDVRRSIVLPVGCDPVVIAAAMNPAMASWVALRRRADFVSGNDVLVLGAAGSAGRMAIQVARHFGARRIIAAARRAEQLARLLALGATETVLLDGDANGSSARAASTVGHAAADVDVVLDFLWGAPAAAAMAAVVRERADRGQSLTWVQIGSVAGATAAIPSAALRAARMQIVGSGQGSVSTRDIVAELTELAAAIATGKLSVAARAVPLRDVEHVWTQDSGTSERLVFTPTP